MTTTNSVVERYSLAPIVAESMSDPASALVKFHEILISLRSEVESLDKATNVEGVKTENPLALKYGEDTEGAKAALDFLRSAIFEAVSEYIGDDPGRTFHTLNAVDGTLVKFLRDEVAYHKSTLVNDAPVPRTRKNEVKSDYNSILALFGNVVGMAVASGFDPKSAPNVVTLDSAGKPRSVLTGYKGTKAVDDGSVSGRYAKVYNILWTIDGEEVEQGTKIVNIVRMLWHGADRIGKNAKSLTDLLDSVSPDWTHKDMVPVEFEVNGHSIRAERPNDDDVEEATD